MNAELTYSWSMSSLIDVTSTTPSDGAAMSSIPEGFRVVINTNNNNIVSNMDIGITESETRSTQEKSLASGESTTKTTTGAIYWENGDAEIPFYEGYTYYIYYTLYNVDGDALTMGMITITGKGKPAGIDAAICDDVPKEIFNMQGISVGTDATQLPKGVYITNGKKFKI